MSYEDELINVVMSSNDLPFGGHPFSEMPVCDADAAFINTVHCIPEPVVFPTFVIVPREDQPLTVPLPLFAPAIRHHSAESEHVWPSAVDLQHHGQPVNIEPNLHHQLNASIADAVAFGDEQAAMYAQTVVESSPLASSSSNQSATASASMDEERWTGSLPNRSMGLMPLEYLCSDYLSAVGQDYAAGVLDSFAPLGQERRPTSTFDPYCRPPMH